MSATTAQELHDRAQRGEADAQFELGRAHAARQEFTRARRHLRRAADAGHPGALNELGLFALFGIGVEPDVADALDLLGKAERAGSGEATYQLALIGWCDDAPRFDPAAIAARLLRAAQLDFPAALRTLALIHAKNAPGRPHWAALSDACLQRAAALGDAISAHLLGRRALLGGDPARARSLFALALARGATRAQAFLDDPAAAPMDPRALAADSALPLETVPLAVPDDCPAVVHSADPLVETRDGVFSAEECEYVIALGDAFLNRSFVVNDRTAETAFNDHRTSSDHSFHTFQDDFGLRWLQWRLTAPLGVPMQNTESLVLLRYRPGEEYKPHRDYLPPSVGNNPALPGQRVHTVFCYLSDVDEGGETEFPLLDVRVAPRLGRVVHFRNLLENGEPDPRTLHAGLPVRHGAKWLATLWTRERRVRPY